MNTYPPKYNVRRAPLSWEKFRVLAIGVTGSYILGEELTATYKENEYLPEEAYEELMDNYDVSNILDD